MKNRIWSVLLMAGVLSCFFSNQAQAVSIRPSVFEFSLDPGASAKSAIAIQNDEDVPKTYFFQIQKFIPEGENGQQKFLPPTETDGVPSWLYLPYPSLTLAPGERIEVPFELRIPATTPPGSHQAALFVGAQPAEGSGANQTGLLSRVGALLFVTVEGELVHKLSLIDFQRSDESSNRGLPIAFSVLVKNEGNAISVPSGDIVITNVFGTTVQRLPLNSDHGRVLPASSRRFLAAWGEKGETSRGFIAGVRHEISHFAFGWYKASPDLPGVTTDSRTALHFWLFPWRLISISLAGVAILLVCLFGWKAGKMARSVS